MSQHRGAPGSVHARDEGWVPMPAGNMVMEHQMPLEQPKADGQSFPLPLQPRESIRAHRLPPVPTWAPPASDPPAPLAPEPLPTLAREPPLPQLKDKDTRSAVKRGLSQRSSGRREPCLPPYVRLERLQMPAEDEGKAEPAPGPGDSAKAAQEPRPDWQVVRDGRARLRVLETASAPALAPAPEVAAPRRQGAVTSHVPRVQGTALWLPGSAASNAPRPPGAAEMSLAGRQVPGGMRSSPGKCSQRFLCTWCCLLALPVLLGVAGWYLWEQGSSVLALGLVGRWPLVQSWGVEPEVPCSQQCSAMLVESLPEGLDYPSGSPRPLAVHQAWMDLLGGANTSVDIAAFYLTLRDLDTSKTETSAWQGREVFERLWDLPARGVQLNVAVNSPQESNADTQDLASKGANVSSVEMKRLTGGVLHSKFWVVDDKHVYVGSANMDWRSLTQVKELGAVLYNCSCVASDLGRIFGTYRALGGPGTPLPAAWPSELAALSSLRRPLKLQLNGVPTQLFLSSAPPALCSAGRTPDLEAILETIADAQAFIHVAVMDFVPQCTFCTPKRFWPVLDEALREAACGRGVRVRLLASCWPHSDRAMFPFLESLLILHREPLGCPIEVKLFVVPATEQQKQIPFARVNHNKYMVTDRVAYIGTSNWSEDYFINTAGVGLVVNQSTEEPGTPGPSLREQLAAVFNRDWESPYTEPLSLKPRCAARH
ncbi:5'-3' exonuclease PLD3 isoform X1 [Alligator mississippiensis]|nr:5'-3' exonuclease PLD3 isoform X1 [Alligator mississippiensis]